MKASVNSVNVSSAWPMTRLKFCLSKMIGGGTPSTDKPELWADMDDPTGIPWVAISDMTRQGHIINTEKRISVLGLEERGLQIIPAGSLIYSMYASLGKVSELGVRATTNQAILGLVPNPQIIDTRFLFWWLEHIRPTVISEASSNTQDNLNAEKVKNLPVILPPLKIQRRIVSVLDEETAKIDKLIAEKEQLLKVLDERRQTLITEAVTRGLDPGVPMKASGIPWLGDIPAHWDVPTVGIRYEVQLGKMLDEKRISGNFLAPYLRNIDVQWEHINTKNLPEMDFEHSDRQRFILHTGDILVCEGGEVGRSAIWRGDIAECYYQKALHRLRQRTAKDYPPFLVHFMRVATLTGGLSADANASTIQHLPAEKLRRLRFPAPPIDEQRTIVEWIESQRDRLRRLEQPLEASINILVEKRAALIHEAVTGQLCIS